MRMGVEGQHLNQRSQGLEQPSSGGAIHRARARLHSPHPQGDDQLADPPQQCHSPERYAQPRSGPSRAPSVLLDASELVAWQEESSNVSRSSGRLGQQLQKLTAEPGSRGKHRTAYLELGHPVGTLAVRSSLSRNRLLLYFEQLGKEPGRSSLRLHTAHQANLEGYRSLVGSQSRVV
jgi:hypothetical protein